MHVARLVLKEALHRKGNFLLSVLAAAAGVACVVGAVLLTRHYRHEMELLLQAERERIATVARAEQDEIRKITKKLGFNILILPKDQVLHEVYAEGFADKTMPEEYASRLARSGLLTVNHLLPCLVQKSDWPEQKRSVLVVGTRGELPAADDKKPILEAVAAGELVVGHELSRQLGLKPGQQLEFRGRSFRVRQCQPARGSRDDVTLWLNLKEAQELLALPDRINAIYALECNCASVDRLGDVRREIAGVLPDTQVIEFQSQAVARAEARNLTQKKALEAVEAQRAVQQHLQRDRESFAAWLTAIVLAACMLWLSLLSYANVRARFGEIAILRSLGVSTPAVLLLFLARASLVGVLAAALGFAAGVVFLRNVAGAGILMQIDGLLLTLSLALAPILAALSAWVPALLATRIDPAHILREV